MEEKKQRQIVVIGGGASGMLAALAASETGSKVTILERQARVGKKLSATGNGRCNITNTNAAYTVYRGKDTEFARYALETFDPESTLNYFRNLGLLCVSEESGRCYPYSDNANSVVDILRFALEAAGVELRCGEQVRSIQKGKNGFQIQTDQSKLTGDRVIIACGGQAGGKLGGVRDGYDLLMTFGHKCTKLYPSLVQLKTEGNFTKALKGVRTNCAVSVFGNKAFLTKSEGELQFTEYGVSGPVIFDISSEARSREKTELRIDLVPILGKNELFEMLRKKVALMPELTSDEIFTGILQNRLGKTLVKACEINGKKLFDLRNNDLSALCRKAKNLSLNVIGDLGFDAAQVTSGGIAVKDFDPKTLESKLCPGLFACGEVLDIDGPCGGYNLQWAWSSGWIAGRAAGEKND